MSALPALRVGIDLVRVSEVAESVSRFGDRYLRRLYTPAEIAYAQENAARMPERLAARFAAKEATVKALGLVEHQGAWSDIEVLRTPSGRCELVLHGRARAAAEELGASSFAVSLSHEAEYATAVVVATVQHLPGA